MTLDPSFSENHNKAGERRVSRWYIWMFLILMLPLALLPFTQLPSHLHLRPVIADADTAIVGINPTSPTGGYYRLTPNETCLILRHIESDTAMMFTFMRKAIRTSATVDLYSAEGRHLGSIILWNIYAPAAHAGKPSIAEWLGQEANNWEMFDFNPHDPTLSPVFVDRAF